MGGRQPSFPRLRLVLFFLVAAPLIPAFVLVFHLASEERQADAERAVETAGHLARVVAHEQNRVAREAREFLAVLARHPSILGADDEAANAHLADLRAAFPRYANIGVVRPDGMIVRSAIPSPPVDVSGRTWFRRAVETREFAVGDFQIGRITHLPTINFAYPVLAESQDVAAVVFVALDLGWVRDLAAGADLPAGSALTLIDRGGTVLLRYPDDGSWMGRDVANDPLFRAMAERGGAGSIEVTGFDGVLRLYAFAPFSPDPGAFVTVGFPAEEIFGEIDRTARRSVLLLGGAALAGLLAAWLIGARAVLRPVGVLVRTTEAIGAGDFAARAGPPYGPGEMGTLGRAVDAMAMALAERAGALAESESRLRALVEHLPAVLYTAGPDGQPRYVSPQVEAMLGVAPPAYLADGALRRNLFHPSDRERVLPERDRALARGLAFQSEYRVVRPDGKVLWISESARWIGEPASAQRYLLGFLVDVTDARRIEEQLRHAQKMESIGQFAGGIAHDFNNLLTAILAFTELAGGSLPDDHPVRSDLDEIKGVAVRAAGLTRQILMFSRRQTFDPRPVLLNDLVRSIESLLGRLIGEDVRLVTALGEGVDPVLADPAQVEQVLVNLAVNARHAMPGGGTLTIETSRVVLDEEYVRTHVAARPGPHALVAVTDTGIGMTDDVKAHLFEPFFTTKDPGHGTGLGLATCYAIVKQMGGHIVVYSEVGRGTSIKIYLPFGTAAEAAEGKAEADDVRGGSETILLVEDEPSVREAARRVLTGFGYRVVEAADGPDAVGIAGSHPGPIDLLFTDAVLPGMGGREIWEKVRALKPAVKVLFTSGYTDRTFRNGLGEGADAAVISKPFTARSLARRVRAVLDGEGP